MRKFTVTVNGQDYDVVVKDGGAAAAAPARLRQQLQLRQQLRLQQQLQLQLQLQLRLQLRLRQQLLQVQAKQLKLQCLVKSSASTNMLVTQ